MNLTEKRSTVRAMENILESRIELFKSERDNNKSKDFEAKVEAIAKAHPAVTRALKKARADLRVATAAVSDIEGVSESEGRLVPANHYRDYRDETNRATQEARIQLERAKAAIWADDDANFSAFIDKLDKLFAVE